MSKAQEQRFSKGWDKLMGRQQGSATEGGEVVYIGIDYAKGYLKECAIQFIKKQPYF